MIEIELPDGSKMSVEAGISGLDVAGKISEGLAKNALAVAFNGKLQDVYTPLTTSGTLSIITSKNKEGLEILRHTASHIMAQAVQKLYPHAQVTIGPVVENGFYYDFDGLDIKLEDLATIEKKMAEIVAADYPIRRKMMKRNEAEAFFLKRGEKYKAEIIRDLPAEIQEVSLYEQGDYVDLCRGPHLPSTGKLGKAFKLMKLAGAYWRGDRLLLISSI